MQLLSQPTSEYLLETGIENLHHQSREWINELLLYNDEIEFFYSVIQSKKKLIVPVNIQNSIWHIEHELTKVSGNELCDIQASMLKHEHHLSVLMKKGVPEESEFRDVHHELGLKLKKFQKHFAGLKRKVFELIEQINNCDGCPNEVVHAIFNRRAVRKYLPKTVSKPLVRKILQAGMMAPSASNKQPWKFYALTRQETIAAFSRHIVKAAMHDSSPAAADLMNYIDDKEVSKYSDVVFYHAPVVVFITAPVTDEWAELSIGMCCENILLAAKSYGLDSCPVGFGKYVSKSSMYPKLKIPHNEKVVFTVILGYGDEKPSEPLRKKDKITFIDD